MMVASQTTLTLTRPDDWHVHVRDDEEMMPLVLRDTCRQMGRAIIMPNLVPPVTTLDTARAYQERILKHRPIGSRFVPLMTMYLTDNTSPDEIVRAQQSGIVHGVKLYPAGATTNSDAGVTSLDTVLPVLEVMAERGMPLLVHGEVTDSTIDVFDREAVFIERVLEPLLRQLPKLKIVFEHITTRQAVDFVLCSASTVAATITAHHLLMSRNALFVGGIRPHHYCLPILKREEHRQALVEAATSGNPQFFLGTDSAPHARHRKEAACGCAGIYTAHAAIELYAEAFEAAGALDRLEAFASFHGPDFYGLPRNDDTITLIKESWQVPARFTSNATEIIPFRAGDSVHWRLREVAS